MARTMFCDQKITKTRYFVVELILILEYIQSRSGLEIHRLSMIGTEKTPIES